jgi:nucleoside-diphosphate-sugar epimerase
MQIAKQSGIHPPCKILIRFVEKKARSMSSNGANKRTIKMIDQRQTCLATKIAKTVGFTGSILWDTSMPDGTPRKVLDSSKINNLGWKPSISLDQGIKLTVQWYLDNN